jgi:histidinol dehydrogenase
MIKIIEKEKILSFLANRRMDFDGEKAKAVEEIISRVRLEGDTAVRYYTEKFDKSCRKMLEASREEIDSAINQVDGYFLETLKIAKENIETFHKKQLGGGFKTENDGIVLGMRYTPVEKVGIYVPGGKAAYPSTVLMNAIPAKIAGVDEIIMVTPPRPDGSIKPEILAAAKIAGVDRVFAIGGAQAVAALAYGTESIPKVYKIVGPGNIYVALAKKLVSGVVGIDMIAGPSEILIIADDTANPSFVASDLLSQAEHDEMASAILITNSNSLAEKVQTEVEKQLNALPRKEIAQKAIKNNSGIIIASNLEECVEFSNQISPEHLELCTANPFELLDRVKNAGSIFLGNYTPEPLGDYIAGPNHTLPTSGNAAFSSPLSVDDFRKKSSFLYYSREKLEEISDRTMDFAKREGLDAHARAIEIRVKDNTP